MFSPCTSVCVRVLMQLLEVRMQYELNDMESPDGGGEQTSALPTPGASPQTSCSPSHPSTSSNNSDGGNMPCLKYETHTQAHGLRKILPSSARANTHTHSYTQESSLLPRAHLRRLSRRLKRSQPQPSLAATHARLSTHDCFRAAAAPACHVSRFHFFFSSSFFSAECAVLL